MCRTMITAERNNEQGRGRWVRDMDTAWEEASASLRRKHSRQGTKVKGISQADIPRRSTLDGGRSEAEDQGGRVPGGRQLIEAQVHVLWPARRRWSQQSQGGTVSGWTISRGGWAGQERVGRGQVESFRALEELWLLLWLSETTGRFWAKKKKKISDMIWVIFNKISPATINRKSEEKNVSGDDGNNLDETWTWLRLK